VADEDIPESARLPPKAEGETSDSEGTKKDKKKAAAAEKRKAKKEAAQAASGTESPEKKPVSPVGVAQLMLGQASQESESGGG
jgi:hypothetical protein